MGEARRKKLLQAAAMKGLEVVNMDLLARAVHKVVTAMTEQSGLDCVYYAQVGAAVLKQLGINARAVAGEAAWRVGPGAGDVISHLEQTTAPSVLYAPHGKESAVFHAWIEMPELGYLLDFTTRNLARKAKLLDEADGGRTQVDWAPDFLMAPMASCAKPGAVTNGYVSGLYAYIPSPAIAQKVMGPRSGHSAEDLASDVESLASATMLAYRQLCRGVDMHVFGPGADDSELQGEQNTPSPPLRPL